MNNVVKAWLATFFLMLTFCGNFLVAEVQITKSLPNESSSASDTKVQVTQEDPSEMIRIAEENLLLTLRTNENLYKDNPGELNKIVEKEALFYFDIPRMAQLTLGKHWRTATDAQKQLFISEYKTYLIRSYVNILFSYRNAEFKIISRQDTGTNACVLKATVQDESKKSINIFIRLERKEHSWKMIDINVEGVSLIVTARGLFGDEIDKKGMDGFIQSLSEQNRNG